MKKKTEQQLINENIKSFKVRVITDEGENIGVLSRDAALNLAQQKNLDLVMLSDQDDIPLVKIMDFGKSLYIKKKKLAEGKKKQKVVKVKEIKLRPKIGHHDYMTKINQGVKFLKAGNKLKVTLMFRGREMETRVAVGSALFDKVTQTFQELGLTNIVHEKDMSAGPFWSRVYMLKAK
ncbi:MAG: translation initiation factor IF-3 [Epsilonproteobacteria bacterium]|nr:translation initiation factor IF-3 [Campylobacterota bacterium]